MLNGELYEIGTEISMVCDNQFICNLRVLNYDKETDSHSWQYMLECRNHSYEIKINFVKVSDEMTFFSYEHINKYKMSKEIGKFLTKAKLAFFKELKTFFETETA